MSTLLSALAFAATGCRSTHADAVQEPVDPERAAAALELAWPAAAASGDEPLLRQLARRAPLCPLLEQHAAKHPRPGVRAAYAGRADLPSEQALTIAESERNQDVLAALVANPGAGPQARAVAVATGKVKPAQALLRAVAELPETADLDAFTDRDTLVAAVSICVPAYPTLSAAGRQALTEVSGELGADDLAQVLRRAGGTPYVVAVVAGARPAPEAVAPEFVPSLAAYVRELLSATSRTDAATDVHARAVMSLLLQRSTLPLEAVVNLSYVAKNEHRTQVEYHRTLAGELGATTAAIAAATDIKELERLTAAVLDPDGAGAGAGLNARVGAATAVLLNPVCTGPLARAVLDVFYSAAAAAIPHARHLWGAREVAEEVTQHLGSPAVISAALQRLAPTERDATLHTLLGCWAHTLATASENRVRGAAARMVSASARWTWFPAALVDELPLAAATQQVTCPTVVDAVADLVLDLADGDQARMAALSAVAVAFPGTVGEFRRSARAALGAD